MQVINSISAVNATVEVCQDAVSSLVAPWIVAYAVATVVSLVAMCINFRVFYKQMRCAHACVCVRIPPHAANNPFRRIFFVQESAQVL